MHKEIFNKSQLELLPYLSKFKRSFYLVGGTAIALHIGHRRSIDFDLFSYSKLKKWKIKSTMMEVPFQQTLLFEDFDQIHYYINDVKVTFFNYPFQIEHKKIIDEFTMPSLLDLAAMKAFALGRRSKWKDYVDLYFIIKNYFSIDEISRKAEQVFPGQFSEKLFRQQLAFHKDIDYTEEIEYLVNPVDENEIKDFLIEAVLEF